MTPRWITAPVRWIADYRDELAIVGLALLYQAVGTGALLPRVARVEERAVTVRVMAPVAVAPMAPLAPVTPAAEKAREAHAGHAEARTRVERRVMTGACCAARAARREARLDEQLRVVHLTADSIREAAIRAALARSSSAVAGAPTEAELASLRRLELDSTMQAARLEARLREAVARAMVSGQAMQGAHVYGAYVSTGS